MHKVLLTGGSGFAGKQLLQKLIPENDWNVVCLNRSPVKYSAVSPSQEYRLKGKIHQVFHDFRSELPEWLLKEAAGVKYIVHMGAEVHGLRSLSNPELFVHSNILGTFNLLEAARILRPEKFIYISSAEAIGSAPKGIFMPEGATLNPSNPYAASKAGAEMLVQAYARSFGVPVIIVRTMNIFGEHQDGSKFIPATVKKMLLGETIDMHIGTDGNSGTRQWLHVREFINGLYYILQNGKVGETYHVCGCEKSNAEIIDMIGLALHIPWKMRPVFPGPSHDMRYSIEDNKLPKSAYNRDNFRDDIDTTIKWYQNNKEFLI